MREGDHHFIESSPVGMGLEGYEEGWGASASPTALSCFARSPYGSPPYGLRSACARCDYCGGNPNLCGCDDWIDSASPQLLAR